MGGLGEVIEGKQHSDSCPKRPWQCQYCEFESTYDIKGDNHFLLCTKRPVECPNSCEVGSVPHCDLESHLLVCPFQPVPCKYVEVGCDVKVPRKDLDHHLNEEQQHHLLSATLLVVKLTKENAEERRNLLRIIEEKDKQIKEKEKEFTQQIKEKDKIIANLLSLLKEVQSGLEAKVTDLHRQVVKYKEDTEQHLTLQDKQVERLLFSKLSSIKYAYIQEGFFVHDFTLTEFTKYQSEDGDGDWYSDAFYSHPGGYHFQLNVETSNGSKYMRVWFLLIEGDHDDVLDWPVSMTAHVQLLNQLGDHNHHEKKSTGWWRKNKRGDHFGKIEKYIEYDKLEFDSLNTIHYLKKDCFCFRVYVKALPKN